MKTVLIVDDTATMRYTLERILRPHYLVIQASNADDALQLIDIHHPEAVILDIIMPGKMDGMELCKLLKSNPKYSDIFVVLATGSWGLLSSNSGKHSANAIFVKPFRAIDILDTLEKGLQHTRTLIKDI